MFIDGFSLFLITCVSILSGSVAYLLLEPENSEVEPLGDYVNSPEYSQGVLDFYKKTIQEWVVIQFNGWLGTHTMEYSNKIHFKKMIAKLLLDFFEDQTLQEQNVRFDYCLFSKKYLYDYISMVAMETISKLVDIHSEESEQ